MFFINKFRIAYKKEIQILVDAKYAHIHQSIENLTVDSDTILNSIAGIIISSVISSFTITLLIYTINSLIVFHFFCLFQLISLIILSFV